MSYYIKGKNNEYEVVIGCEIHAQIFSKSKLFSRSATKFGSPQNSQVSFVDAAMPGMLPTINHFAIKQTIKTGLAINAKINLESIFDRKNYFYPDLPQGYQISQYLDPIVGLGELEIELEDESKKKIGVTRIHMEQDAGKLIHDQHPSLSFVDLNRSGIALMEIVSEPDISSPYEACQYVKKIRSIVRAIKTCDGDMEKGNLRCDANVSVRVKGSKELGTRCEIKNLNSISNIQKAIQFEAKRQVEIIENNGIINQETRLFDAVNNETRTMRSKEDAMDYRYFPDPDLPPLTISQDLVDSLKAELPELPDVKKERYMNEFKISNYDAGVLTSDSKISAYFEDLVKKHNPKLSVTWLTVELLGRMNKLNLNFNNLPISSQNLSELLDFIDKGDISAKIAKEVLDLMFETGKNAAKIIEEKGLKQVSDDKAITSMIETVLNENSDKVTEYKSGKDKLFGFFVGQVMKASKGQANPGLVNKILKEKLK
ncbi:Asp-tRNA(Asn)/Glu-tRNA(Gln) amidotransferase subunit GatB [Rickettsiales bacterium]|nr:Asp-tRNA(Asn)/Glu-tRNA(Gln) amidotransferase subunit GatB [Rickettsiales bacterium]